MTLRSQRGSKKSCWKSQFNISHTKFSHWKENRTKGSDFSSSQMRAGSTSGKYQLETNTKRYYSLSAWGKVSLTSLDRGELEGRIRKMQQLGLTVPVAEFPDGTDHYHWVARPQPTTTHLIQPTGGCKTLSRERRNWHTFTALQFSLIFLVNGLPSDCSLLYQVLTASVREAYSYDILR